MDVFILIVAVAIRMHFSGPINPYTTHFFQRIKDYVKRCLAKADTLTFKSICFPTIGTGNFKYPNSESAQETFSAIQEYFSSPPQHLQKVVIALFRGAPNAIQVREL